MDVESPESSNQLRITFTFCLFPEAQPQSPVKDKSPWRKSNLNVPNTSEQTEMDVRRLRRLKSRGSIDNSNLQVRNIL